MVQSIVFPHTTEHDLLIIGDAPYVTKQRSSRSFGAISVYENTTRGTTNTRSDYPSIALHNLFAFHKSTCIQVSNTNSSVSVSTLVYSTNSIHYPTQPTSYSVESSGSLFCRKSRRMQGSPRSIARQTTLPQQPRSQSFDRLESSQTHLTYITAFSFHDDDDIGDQDGDGDDAGDSQPLLIDSHAGDSEAIFEASHIALKHKAKGVSQPLQKTSGVSIPHSTSFLHDNLSNIVMLVTIFTCALAMLAAMYFYMPDFDPKDRPYIKLPRSFEDVKNLSEVVEKYKHQHFLYVIALFSAMYIALQTFAIPGAVFLSILAGPLYGILPGIFIISTVATIGSSLCFLLSKTLGAPLVKYFFPSQLKMFQSKIDENRDGLFFYLLFLRVAPVLPNWLINIASPVLRIDYASFAIATFLGVMPNNYIMTTVGVSLQSVTDPGPLITPKSFISLTLIGLVALLPLWLKWKMASPQPPATETTPPSPSSIQIS